LKERRQHKDPSTNSHSNVQVALISVDKSIHGWEYNKQQEQQPRDLAFLVAP